MKLFSVTLTLAFFCFIMDPNKTNLSESPAPSPAPSPVVATPSVVAPVAASSPVTAAAPSSAPALKKAKIGSMKRGPKKGEKKQK